MVPPGFPPERSLLGFTDSPRLTSSSRLSSTEGRRKDIAERISPSAVWRTHPYTGDGQLPTSHSASGYHHRIPRYASMAQTWYTGIAPEFACEAGSKGRVGDGGELGLAGNLCGLVALVDSVSYTVNLTRQCRVLFRSWYTGLLSQA